MPDNPTTPIRSQEIHKSLNRIPITLLLIFFLILSVVSILALADKIQANEPFSEFYINDTNELLKNNHIELSPNQEINLKVGFTNKEGAKSLYRVVVLINGQFYSTTKEIALNDGGESEFSIPLKLTSVGENQKVDLLLWKRDSPFPYRSLHLLVTVE